MSDMGGTTTDIVVVEDGVVRAEARGRIEGVQTAFPLCDVVSVGVGGSSIIRAEGGARFHVCSTRIRDNGLMHGQVDMWPDESAQTIPPEFSLLTTILDRLLECLHSPWVNATRTYFEDASWVGFRLAELLPLELPERQYLLQMTDPIERLNQLVHYLPRFQSG